MRADDMDTAEDKMAWHKTNCNCAPYITSASAGPSSSDHQQLSFPAGDFSNCKTTSCTVTAPYGLRDITLDNQHRMLLTAACSGSIVEGRDSEHCCCLPERKRGFMQDRSSQLVLQYSVSAFGHKSDINIFAGVAILHEAYQDPPS